MNIYRVVQIKVYDRVCGLNQLIKWFFCLFLFFTYLQTIFFSKHVFKINTNKFCGIGASLITCTKRSPRGCDLNGFTLICNYFVNYLINECNIKNLWHSLGCRLDYKLLFGPTPLYISDCCWIWSWEWRSWKIWNLWWSSVRSRGRCGRGRGELVLISRDWCSSDISWSNFTKTFKECLTLWVHIFRKKCVLISEVVEGHF